MIATAPQVAIADRRKSCVRSAVVAQPHLKGTVIGVLIAALSATSITAAVIATVRNAKPSRRPDGWRTVAIAVVGLKRPLASGILGSLLQSISRRLGGGKCSREIPCLRNIMGVNQERSTGLDVSSTRIRFMEMILVRKKFCNRSR